MVAQLRDELVENVAARRSEVGERPCKRLRCCVVGCRCVHKDLPDSLGAFTLGVRQIMHCRRKQPRFAQLLHGRQ